MEKTVYISNFYCGEFSPHPNGSLLPSKGEKEKHKEKPVMFTTIDDKKGKE